ncbi:DEAD/DEAH box helicase [Ceratobasidium sp. AG-Ba]|nr:DEAD/DEAH box helicase [Ceratobasidium sp. AG-Ba]
MANKLDPASSPFYPSSTAPLTVQPPAEDRRRVRIRASSARPRWPEHGEYGVWDRPDANREPIFTILAVRGEPTGIACALERKYVAAAAASDWTTSGPHTTGTYHQIWLSLVFIAAAGLSVRELWNILDRARYTHDDRPLTLGVQSGFRSETISPASSVRSLTLADVGSFDAHAKASPFLNDILDRLIRCEYTNRDIHRELQGLTKSVAFLVERADQSGLPLIHQPRDDEIKQLGQRVSALTASCPSPVTPQLGLEQLPPHVMTPRGGAPQRGPVPVRTWSSGSIDVGGRGLAPDSAIRGPDKRRSVSSLIRRDSASALDVLAGDASWGGGSPRNEAGPVISKWEHLPLAPDLLRSIAKYGVGPPNKIQQRALPFLLRGSDIIAQAPPTQERIAAYVIPAIHVALTTMIGKPTIRGPLVVIISTTVDQATQAQRMIRDLGGPIGVRSALGVGTGGDVVQELRMLQQSIPHILCGTPQKLHALFTAPGGLFGGEVRLLVLDEVDQLIARNLHEFVYTIVRLFPAPRGRPLSSPAVGPGAFSPFEPQTTPNRFSRMNSPIPPDPNSSTIERQTALFSNTVPQDVLNLANAIQLREPVRVLVRRDGGATHADTSTHSRGLRQFYLYLAFTAGGARADPAPATPGGGLGIIGSGRGGAASAETAQAREWKLDALADLLDDADVTQVIVHVGGLISMESVVFKLASKGLEAVPLHGEMNATAKLAALNKFRSTNAGPNGVPNGQQTGGGRQQMRVLVVYDVPVKAPDVFQVPLVINYDLPKAVEEYAHRVAPAISSSYSRAGVVVNFVTATGGDVEMLRSIECFYKIKCPEVPMSLRDVL